MTVTFKVLEVTPMNCNSPFVMDQWNMVEQAGTCTFIRPTELQCVYFCSKYTTYTAILFLGVSCINPTCAFLVVISLLQFLMVYVLLLGCYLKEQTETDYDLFITLNIYVSSL